MVYPHGHSKPRPTLNAIPPSRQQLAPDRAQRTERNLRVCNELIEIGMILARAAAERAVADMAAPPISMPIPSSSAAAIEQAEERARHRMPDYGRVFTHVSRAVRQTILLETHIADGRSPAQHAEPRPPAIHDRNIHRPASGTEADANPHTETLRRETVERLDCDLTASPIDDAAVEALLQTIADEFGQSFGPAHDPAGNPSLKKPDRLRPHPPEPTRQASQTDLRPPRNTVRQPTRR